MSPTFGIVMMLNNYLHDVATALLLASGIVLWLMLRKFGDHENSSTLDYFLDLHKSITRLAVFSLIWIIVGGIPRTIFYKDFEWANAVGKNQVPALIVKHVIAFTFVGAGAYVWIKISKKIKKHKKNINLVK